MSVNQRKTSPMTARTLETLIRLSTAHAKARLANTVDEDDAQVASDILKFALFREVVEDEKVKKRRLRAEARAAAGRESSDEESSEDEASSVGSRSRSHSPLTPRRNTRSQRSRQGRRGARAVSEDVMDVDEEDEDIYGEPSSSNSRIRATQQSESQQSFASSVPGLDSQSQPTQNQPTPPMTISPARLEVFTERMAEVTQGALFEAGGATVASVIEAVNEGMDQEEKFSQEEGEKGLDEMMEKNLIMVSGKIVYTV